MKSTNNTAIESDGAFSLTAADTMTVACNGKIGVVSGGVLALVSTNGSWNGGENLALQAGGIDLNGGGAEGVDAPTPLQKYVMPSTQFDSSSGWTVQANGLESIVTRAPTHEPWPYHNKGVAESISLEEGQPSTPPNTPEVPGGWSITAE
jgi:hypothetical protein